MSRLRSLALAGVQTLLRMLPFPCRTGLVEIGRPGPDSPVLLTGNFWLTVERVKRALGGLDAFLLVANSRGVNVWCAATGGLLTNHDVISVLKTSGVGERVKHRRLILPQLAATGIEGGEVHKKTGWRVHWGPVRCEDLPVYLRNGLRKTVAMRTVSFPWRERLEMAVAWAFPISLLSLVLLPFWPGGVAPLMAVVWALSLLLFLAFPLYEPLVRGKKKHIGFVFFDFGERGIVLLLWLVLLAGLALTSALSDDYSAGFAVRWGVASFVVLAILGLDLTGSTPLYKSGLHEDRQLRITLDEARCKGAGFCEQSCPTHVFEMEPSRKLVRLPRSERCVQCGACIVQCPFDALFFQSPDGEVVSPETIRRYKLNLLGTRRVQAPELTH
ncbi:MAG: HgcAB-like fusion protein [Myxococcota bacterium]